MKHIKGEHGPLHWLFESTLVLKSVFALLEIAAGLGLWLVPHARIEDLTGWLVQSHLIEGHGSPVYARVAQAMGAFSLASQHFYALYLAAHGVVKLAIVLLLMRRVAFAYPLGIVVFSGFIVTQLHRWSHTHSPVLLTLSALDLVVIGLTWREWRGQRG
ncbi:DUF2127 domain-containing protein [Paracoccus yeei]|jgi:uncharacterized membrane protein|uniref:DUF2127 domain-containing protein n=1 Tax=Paracoccus yeei TaxID=147645 RepID=UPI003BF87B11